MSEKKQMKNVEAIKTYLEPPKITIQELKELSKEERLEIGKLCAKELGVEIIQS